MDVLLQYVLPCKMSDLARVGADAVGHVSYGFCFTRCLFRLDSRCYGVKGSPGAVALGLFVREAAWTDLRVEERPFDFWHCNGFQMDFLKQAPDFISQLL